MRYLVVLLLFFPITLNAGENTVYFPRGKLSDDYWYDNKKIEFYSECLIAMQEPSLMEISKTRQQVDIYRFLLMRTFDHPVCIRIEISNSGDATVYKKVTSGKGGYYPGNLLVSETRNITKNDVQALLKQINETKLWELQSSDFPVYKKDGENWLITTDGSSWIFEGLKDGKYQLIEMHRPNYGSEELNKNIIELGKSFLALADLQIDPLY